MSFTHHGKPWLKHITFIFQELQAELEVQQEHVNNLQNMVVVVDEVAGDTSEYYWGLDSEKTVISCCYNHHIIH